MYKTFILTDLLLLQRSTENAFPLFPHMGSCIATITIYYLECCKGSSLNDVTPLMVIARQQQQDFARFPVHAFSK
jgi:hypothetical protein